jgi:RES domain-containing protein
VLTAWRIVKAKYAASAFDGEGARLAGGRWTSIGRRAVYASGSVALAALEMIAHLDTTALLPAYVLIEVTVPESLVTSVDVATLPSDWRRYPAPAELRRIGDRWLDGKASAVLRVPSVLVAVEYNYVLNPGHPDFGRIRTGAPAHFPLDPRLL